MTGTSLFPFLKVYNVLLLFLKATFHLPPPPFSQKNQKYFSVIVYLKLNLPGRKQKNTTKITFFMLVSFEMPEKTAFSFLLYMPFCFPHHFALFFLLTLFLSINFWSSRFLPASLLYLSIAFFIFFFSSFSLFLIFFFSFCSHTSYVEFFSFPSSLYHAHFFTAPLYFLMKLQFFFNWHTIAHSIPRG